MSLHDDAWFQEIYQDALRALEYLPHLESYPTERARIAERFTSEFLARHPEPDVSDGEREALENLLSDEFVKDSAGFGSCNLPRTIADALLAAGYRKAPVVNVEDVTDLLVAHQRASSEKCLCGWGELGRSHARHVATAINAHLLGGA